MCKVTLSRRPPHARPASISGPSSMETTMGTCGQRSLPVPEVLRLCRVVALGVSRDAPLPTGRPISYFADELLQLLGMASLGGLVPNVGQIAGALGVGLFEEVGALVAVQEKLATQKAVRKIDRDAGQGKQRSITEAFGLKIVKGRNSFGSTPVNYTMRIWAGAFCS